MTAILGYSDMMLEPASTLSDRQDCLQVIRRNARHLMQLINDILDISKIEAEKMLVEQISTDLPQLVIEAVSMIRPKAMEKELLLSVDFEGAIPRQVCTDPLRLKQILMNLMGNAIKFTAKGGVRLSVSCDRESGMIQFDIHDSGIGMTADQLSRLFRPFTQADDSMTRKYGGTGLGLVISKKLANLLGGDITVASAQKVGSTFTVNVAVGSLSDAEMLSGLSESLLAPIENNAPPLQTVLQGRILLAEDGLDNQCLISTHLIRAGAEVVIAENGRVAIDKIQAHHFDVILMDMQMPVLDGYGATSELRERGFKLPIIALTAHAMAGDREKCLAAGCTDYLTKPIDKERLLSVVNAHLISARKKNTSATAASPDVTPTLKSLEINKPSPKLQNDGMQDLVAGFVGRLPARVIALLDHHKKGNREELQRAVHQLKGAGTGYGLPTITQLAASVEQHLKGGSSSADVDRELEGLVKYIRGIEGYDLKLELPHAA
jgi:CheY-like chemotaxis protein